LSRSPNVDHTKGAYVELKSGQDEALVAGTKAPFSMLGLGDIVIPGIYVVGRCTSTPS
jgi:presenilin-like A22 family membrane protease